MKNGTDQGSAPSTLQSLGVQLMAQDSLEKKVAETADKAMLAREIELDEKRLEKTEKQYKKYTHKISQLQSKLERPNIRISEKEAIRKEIADIKDLDLKPLIADLKDLRKRLAESQKKSSIDTQNQIDDSTTQLPTETKQEFLIRTGKITAFGSSNGFIQDDNAKPENLPNHQNLIAPGLEGLEKINDEEYDYGSVSDDDDEIVEVFPTQANIDDGDEATYQRRLKQWVSRRSRLRAENRPDYVDDPTIEEWRKPHPTNNDAVLNDEFRIPGDIYPSLFDYQKTCVQWLWELYAQKTGGIIGDEMGLGKTVQLISFLAGLHYSGKLDKPILIVCPATVLKQWCNEFHRWWPAMRTVILHSIGTGMTGKKSKKDLDDDEALELLMEQSEYGSKKSLGGLQSDRNAKDLINKVVSKGHVIITTYVGARIYSKYLLPVKWGYVALDEGHKIRNPDSYITLTCKQFKTPNRVILSGTPIQNNLVELWSLFDFVFPGRLGTLPVFQRQFCVPINLGGYANATNVQVQTSYKCAVILRDLIAPYLLRRVKSDVAKDLPKKSEMVLFCKLTSQQRTLYENFLSSEDVTKIVKGSRNALYGIDILRKICNHPDLVDLSVKGKLAPNGTSTKIQERSGKLQVVNTLLDTWVGEGRKVLVFTQTRQMLDILQQFMEAKVRENKMRYNFLRMDGSTPIGSRQTLVDQFNNDPQYPVFLLTTRVGGLGVNLTGASRVIIYDPDWNPSTDLQARERAWRLGQKKDVTIYRLMIAGSIEEKIYHRQIFKQLLTNKILKDPKQKRFFKMNDLYDLFTLGDDNTKGTETADISTASPLNNGKDDDDFLQVSQIKGVSSLQHFEDGSNSNDDGEKEDADLMAGLFKSSGIHSTLEHDSVLNASSDANLIDSEATRIAEEAVKALRESRKETRKTNIGVPTWTGKFGKAGRLQSPQKKKASMSIGGSLSTSRVNSNTTSREGSPSPIVSSSSILASMQKKKQQTMAPKTARRQMVSTEDDAALIRRLSEYMSGIDGFFSTSGAILDNLNVDVSNEKTVKVVRGMLKSICTWDKTKKGWILNEEFR
ncbi:hypothetical protein CANARDRAFT_199401 [[Candida] arabinofermentans NRRL YB-2248]|uniref:DNA repair and recombination protein RAD26 n=1 Tax=[Candida] arabinofermentans NRRL YB-2248 TaxID=983967 RepID=A0A1E4T0Q9_9ASCO|nr:hypothetical protein CANARDRAFT_199401 [[Candida] arabinofermentans NRRL YB-2248]